MRATANTMQTFVGICSHAPSNRPIIGRITFGHMPNIPREDAYLLVVDAPCAYSQEDMGNPVAIIEIGVTEENIEPVGASVCPILRLPRLPDSCQGKVALLDPRGGVLFVSPDIGVFNRFGTRLADPAPYPSLDPILLPNGFRVRLGTVLAHDDWFPPTEAESLFLLPDPSAGEEDALYEHYRDLAESSPDRPLIALIPAPSTDNDLVFFHNRIRALFRAAIFGSFSLLFQGILTLGEWNSLLSELKKIRAELQREDREFNECLPKGILVDIPLLLQSDLYTDIDFLCLDLDRLWDLSTGYAPHHRQGSEDAFIQFLCEHLLRDHLPPIALLTNCISLPSRLSPFWTARRVTDCFVPPSSLVDTRRMLSEINSKEIPESI